MYNPGVRFESDAPGKTFLTPEDILLFQKGIVQDGTTLIKKSPSMTSMPMMQKNWVVFSMNEQYVAPDVERLTIDSSINLFPETETLPQGCEFRDVLKDSKTGAVTEFDLLLRPQFNPDDAAKLEFLAYALVQEEGNTESAASLLDRMLPRVHIDSERGITVVQNGDFLAGIGPEFSPDGVEYGEAFIERFEEGMARDLKPQERPFGIEFVIADGEIARQDDFGVKATERFTIQGGVRVHAPSVAAAQRTIKRILSVNPKAVDALYRVVEPYYYFTTPFRVPVTSETPLTDEI